MGKTHDYAPPERAAGLGRTEARLPWDEIPATTRQAWAWKRQGEGAERRESSSYGYVHKDGYQGHQPADPRNRGKVGKTLKDFELFSSAKPIASESAGQELYVQTDHIENRVEQVDNWRKDLKDYTRARRMSARPPETNRSAGVSNESRTKKQLDEFQTPQRVIIERQMTQGESGAMTSNSHKSAEGDDKRKSSAYDFHFHHESTYGGHLPVTARNKSKYGKTFGRSDKRVQSGALGQSLHGAPPPDEILDRLGRGVELKQEDPRPPRVKNEKGGGVVPRMHDEVPPESGTGMRTTRGGNPSSTNRRESHQWWVHAK